MKTIQHQIKLVQNCDDKHVEYVFNGDCHIDVYFQYWNEFLLGIGFHPETIANYYTSPKGE